ncbi:MAG: dihydroorotase [Christensenellaceae bacterium]|jgi:dihydroorotase
MRILIRDICVVNTEKTIEHADILIENGMIADIGEISATRLDTVIEGSGLHAFPGFIDMHCHLRDPGQTHKEDIESGSRSAAAGGFTTICCMANTQPVADCAEVLTYIRKRAKEVGAVRLLPIACVTKGMEGRELADFASLHSLGAVAVSDDGSPLMDEKVAQEAILKAQKADVPIMLHEEALDLKQGGVMNESEASKKAGLPGIGADVEDRMTERDLDICERTGAAIHICHVSTKGSVEMIRRAKQRGVKVTCETAPHYFSLTDADAAQIGPDAKMNPPLRGIEDVLAVVRGLRDGTIDAIATDHAPHSEKEKEKGMLKAPFGIIGFETAFSLVVTNLLKTGEITVNDISRLMSLAPASILRLHGGAVRPGAAADITICDLGEKYVYKKESIVSKAKNSPFIGRELMGRVLYTIVEGEVRYDRRSDR